jgi:DNA-binding NarL/FixJ family response regulator
VIIAGTGASVIVNTMRPEAEPHTVSREAPVGFLRSILRPSGQLRRQRSDTKRIRVVLVDDHPIVRAGIRAELEKSPSVDVVGEANDGREALELVKTHEIDVVLMDISMRGLNGIEATARITKEFPKVRVIILSRHEGEEYFWGALRAGASGYLLKKAVTTELFTAVERVAGGEVYLAREISNRLVKQLPIQIANKKSPLDLLTVRQREILQLMAEGQTDKDIALILKVSPKTVAFHRAKLMERLNIYDIPGLVRFALQSGLISEE